MDILEWRPLVLKTVGRYSSTLKRARVEYEDAIQAGMIGLLLAERDCPEDSKFMSYAAMAIRREIQRLIYTDVKRKDLRVREAPLSPEMVIESLGEHEDEALSMHEVREFCSKLPVKERERKLFTDMVEHGQREAGLMYRQETGMTRQGLAFWRNMVREEAKILYEER